MANVRQGFDTGPLEAYYAIPPVTRSFFTACLAVSLLTKLKILSPYLLYLNWSLIFKLQVNGNALCNATLVFTGAISLLLFHFCFIDLLSMQVWRLLTPFTVIVGSGFRILIQLVWL